MTEKQISVIVPCYNVENYIDRCFDSIAKQTFGIEQLEIIMVDDASTDNTWQKMVEIEKQYPESVMIIHLDENGRQGRARNLALTYASAPFIMYVDSDDWIEEDIIQVLFDAMMQNDCDVVSCGFVRDDGKGGNINALSEQSEFKVFNIDNDKKRGVFLMCMSMGLTVWGKLYKRSFLCENDIYFPEGCAYEDRFTMLLMYMYAKKIAVTDRELYHYFVNEQSTVMKKGADHHFDMIRVDDYAFNELRKRGFIDRNGQEIECYYLLIAYAAALKVISFTYDNPPYEFYIELRESLIDKFPNFACNPYIKEYATEFNYYVIQTLSSKLSREEFASLCSSFRKKLKMG